MDSNSSTSLIKAFFHSSPSSPYSIAHNLSLKYLGQREKQICLRYPLLSIILKDFLIFYFMLSMSLAA